MALCERLICKPRVVPKRMQTVEYDRLVHIPFLRNAAEVLIADLGLHKTAPEWSTLPLPISADLWPSTHTLRLRNMDPLVLVRFCPNLACLHITFKSFANDWLVFFAGDHRFPYTASFAHDVSARLRVLEVFVEGRGPMPGETVVATVRATQPVVFSVECYDGAAFWGQLAALFEHPAARLRYLDVLMHGDVDDAQKWMDKYLPLLSASNILCVRLKLALDSNDFNVSSDFDSHSDTGYDNDGKWEKLGNAAPRLLAEEIPTLRYVAVASGRMVVNADSDIPQGSIFRGRMHRWWRIDAGEAVAEKRSVDLVEISAEEGQRLDEYMRGEAFADTLQL
ncbi:uncharacterized protein B0H18DRAFT_1036683 [Fomitopsis serialis]|uniref:uncharacterized protein n=1 Tax=Fomitopsis serialis TaxID=139415 RepID=UPI0020086E9E|nr:uncharacterized protein B0H18DRAFT_1036683 [Neoantrodia serialis]KAH9916871.1 hypothetical protein B0H18DRAFT_1036683 [Neoantrodia serialis]